MAMKLFFAIRTISLNQSWQMVPLYREIVSRGHHADVYANVDSLSTTIPLELSGIPWEPIESYSDKLYDIVIESTPELSGYALAPAGFSIGFYCGGCGDWLATCDSLPDIAMHTLWVGHNQFELDSRHKQGYEGEFPLIGMPSLSNYKGYLPQRKDTLKGLYFNGCPFLQENKERFNQFIITFARTYPNIEIHLKDRFFGKDEGSHYALTRLQDNGIRNIIIHDGNTSSVDLVKEADFMFGLSTTGFIETLFLNKPVFIIKDFDTEYHFGYLASEIYSHCTPGFTIVESDNFIRNFDQIFSKAKRLDLEQFQSLFPTKDPCKEIIAMAESLYAAAEERKLDSVNITFDPRNQKKMQAFLKDYDKHYRSLVEHRDDQIFILKVLREFLRRIRYITPYMPYKYYTKFIASFKEQYRHHKNNPEWQVGLFENMGMVFYRYMQAIGGIQKEWLPPKNTLNERQAERYLKEAEELHIFDSV